jgi:hypothetical protein
MKHISILSLLVIFCAALLFTSCGGDNKGKNGKNGTSTGVTAENFKAEPGQGTPIHFAHLKMDFKPVTSGDTVKAVYPFKNMTNLPVAISSVQTSCPCMMTDFTKGNIQPGEVGEVRVNFATAGQFGDHYKLISVILQGSNEPITLQLNGKINQAPQ